MTEPMTDMFASGRFQELADAYGGVIARWPPEYRADAAQQARRPEATAILMAALALDETLDAWRVPLPSPRLFARVIAAGPVPRWGAALRLWWSGIGIATALAGAAAGMAAVTLAAPSDAPPAATTSFGDVAGQDG